MKNFLRIFIYCWVSLAILNVAIGLITMELLGGFGNSDFPRFYISLPLLIALILNIILVEKIHTINKQNTTVRKNIIIQIVAIVFLEIVLAAYSFYLQTFGEELIILIVISAFLASTNLYYLKLSIDHTREMDSF